MTNIDIIQALDNIRIISMNLRKLSHLYEL